ARTRAALARLRRPPDGHGGRAGRPPRTWSPGRRRGVHRQDPPRLPRPLGSPGGQLSPREYDESDVRVRPGRGSRPRSKRRPEHAGAGPAMVTTVDRGRWTCAPDGDATREPVTAMRARELGRTPIVVGDRVGLVGDLSGKPDTLA